MISSVMNFDQLCTSMGENPAIDLRKSTFVPCDGRSIAGSDLHKKTNIAVAPDLRGKFVRGLNVFYNPGEPDWDSHATGDPEGAHRNVSSYQPDAFANHAHAWNSGQGFNAGGGGSIYARNDAGFNVSNSTTATGGQETRPRNIALYFYLKIN